MTGFAALGFSFFNSAKAGASTGLSQQLKASGPVKLEVKTKRLNLTHTWTISRNSSDYKDNVFVRLECDGITGFGEAAPNVRYGENAELTTQRINEARPVFEKSNLFHFANIKDALDAKILDQSKMKWLQTQGVELIEQPMPSDMIEEAAWLRERIDIPILADEAVKSAADIPKLAKAFDGINIKLMKSGGIQEALRMIYMAKSLGMKIMIGCMIESSVAIAAAAHLTPYLDYADLDGNLLISNDPFKGLACDKGKLVFSEKPGLGVEGEF